LGYMPPDKSSTNENIENISLNIGFRPIIPIARRADGGGPRRVVR